MTTKSLLVMFFLCCASFSVAGELPSPEAVFTDSMKWQDETGAVVTLAQWQGRRIFLTMSYTECRKTCPLVTLKNLQKIQAELKKNKQDAEFIIVSFDPKNDTPAVLLAYKKRMGLMFPNWHFLTGNVEDTEKLAALLGLTAWKYDEHIIHKFKIHVYSPAGKHEQLLDWDHRDYVYH